MKKFNYHTPLSIDEGYRLYQSREFPLYLAGGMTLLPSIKQGLSAPTDLIDLNSINDMKGVSYNNGKLIIGSLTTHNEVAYSKIVLKKLPGLAKLASKIADNAIRNKGTLGGSVCNADPAADYPAALLSLRAKLVTNKRQIHANEFFIDMFETSLEPGEILKSIFFDVSEYSCYEKFSSQASKYAIVGVFLSIINSKVNVAVTGASNKVFIIKEISNCDIGKLKEFDLEKLDLNTYDINNDINASSEYRISIIKTLIKKILNKVST